MEARAGAAEGALEQTRQQLSEQQRVADEQIQQLTAERDESRAQFSEVESRTQMLETQFLAASEQFREQRETALQVIRQLEEEREAQQARVSELEADAASLEAELTTVRAQLQHQNGQAAFSASLRSEMLDAILTMHAQSQKILDLLQTWGPNAGYGTEGPTELDSEQTTSLKVHRTND
jgi:chromosome segregation ATPase